MSETESGPSFYALPVIELVHDIETEIVHQIPDADRDDDRLIRCDLAQGAPIEMIEMRVGHEDEIDLRQVESIETPASSGA